MVDSSSPYLGALGTIAKTRWQEHQKFAYLATKTVLLQRHFCTLYTCNFHFNLHISQPFSPYQLLVATDFCISAEAVSTQQQGFLIYFFFLLFVLFMTKLDSFQFIFRKVYGKFAVQTSGNNPVTWLQKFQFWMRSCRFRCCQSSRLSL